MSTVLQIIPTLDALQPSLAVDHPNADLNCLLWTKEELEANLSSPEAKVDTINKVLNEFEQFEDLDQFINNSDGYLSTWIDDGEDRGLSTFSDLSAVSPTDMKPTITMGRNLGETTANQPLITDLETFNWPNNGAFTPPQSPPYLESGVPHPAVLTTLEPYQNVHQANDFHYPVAAQDYKIVIPDLVPSIPQPDVAKELAVVEELVRIRVEFMVPSSPSSSSSSNFGDSSSEDPEWSEASSSSSSKMSTKGRKRSKPYSTGEDKRCRKKEQNKNAATRYRIKKKAEIDLLLNEEKDLQDENTKLDNSISDLQREISYIKGLMREIFKAKGLIK